VGPSGPISWLGGRQSDSDNVIHGLPLSATIGDATILTLRSRTAVGLRHRAERAIAVALLLAVAAFGSLASAQTVTSASISSVLAGGAVDAIARQTDGKVIVGGTFAFVNGVPRSGLARLNADGSLDATWNPAPDGVVAALAIDSGGNIYVGGSFNNIGGAARTNLAKLSSSGSGAADPTWNPHPDDSGYGISALAVDPVSGALFVGGWFNNIGGQPRISIAKLSTSGAGAADAAWKPNANFGVGALLIDGAGTVYAGGTFTIMGGLTRIHLARISSVGTVDPSWDPNPTGGFDRVEELAFDPLTGDVYAAGFFSSIGGQPIFNLAKVSISGTGAAVTSWNPHANGEVTALAVDAAGDVYAGGLLGSAGGQNQNMVKLSGTTAVADPTWNPLGPFNAGGSPFPGAAASSPTYAFMVDPSGRLLAGGAFTNIGGLIKTGFAVLSGSGTGAADPAWASVQSPGAVHALVRDSLGRTIIGGSFAFMGDALTVRNNIARLNPDTTLDTTWDPSADFEVDALALDASNNVYAAGQFTSIGGLTRNFLARLASTGSGTADATWNPNPDGRVAALVLDAPDGFIFAGGSFGNIGGQARANLAKISISGSGSADATWNPGPTPGSSVYSTIDVLTLDGGGNLYVGGNFLTIGAQTRNSLARLSTSGFGAVDPTWNPNPTSAADARYIQIGALTLDGSGNLYIGGGFTNIGGQARNNIARVSTAASGAADATWNPDANEFVGAILPDGSGHVYVGGNFFGPKDFVFLTIGGSTHSFIARVFASGVGTADCHWIANANGPVFALALDAGNNLYAGGVFSTIAGGAHDGFAELAGTTAADCQLGITAVNSGIDASANFPFSLTVQSQDSTGAAQSVVTDTVVTLSVASGTGTLSGTTSCQINAGVYSCTMPGVVYSHAESGVILTATRTSGDVLVPGNGAPLTFIVTPPPAALAFLDVNGGAHPDAGIGFPVTVQAQDATGAPVVVDVATSVSLVASAVTGVLANVGGFNPTCSINAGASTCTVTGVTYSKAESGVVFTAIANYGAGVLAGNSQPVTVDEPPGGRTLTVNLPISLGDNVVTTPAGLNCISGTCTAAFPVGSSVTLNFLIMGDVTFGHWVGDCSGAAPTCTLTMDSDKVVGVSVGNVGTQSVVTQDFAIQSTTTVVGTANPRIDQPQTRLLGRYRGTVVYDQTFNAPFSDPAVQAGVSAADNAIRIAASNAALVVGPPALVGSTDTVLSTATRFSDVVAASIVDNVTTVVGPATVTTGDLGICVLAPTNCLGPPTTFTPRAGEPDINALIVTFVNTSRTIVNTTTHRIASTYAIGDGLLDSNANLSALALSSGSLAPAFAPGTLSYTDSVSNCVASIAVTPTLEDPAASVQVNGAIVASGAPSAPISLAVGVNQINVAVTAQDGATTEIYRIAVTRAAPGGSAPTLQNVVSRRVHGSAGTFDLPLSLVSTNPTTEPRRGPTQTIVFTFDKAINGATASIGDGIATAAAPTFSGNDVVVGLSGVSDQQYVTVGLASVASTDGGSGGCGSVRLGFLVGDVNQNRVVTIADLGLVNAQLTQFVTSTNFLKDVNASGTLTVADKGIVNANLTRSLPAP
jgi:Cadherin-like beta sandwich domain/Domain of unknown function (DUF5122) beta-propeller